jgi:FlgN protein
MEKLSEIMSRERELLDILLFKLAEEQMVLASGHTRWLGRAAREVENVLDTVRQTELLRAVAADELAASLGLEANPSLRSLADAVDEPWRTIFHDHHAAFVATIAESDRVADVDVDAGTRHHRFEAAVHAAAPGSPLRQAALHAVGGTTTCVPQPSLVDFLR